MITDRLFFFKCRYCSTKVKQNTCPITLKNNVFLLLITLIIIIQVLHEKAVSVLLIIDYFASVASKCCPWNYDSRLSAHLNLVVVIS